MSFNCPQAPGAADPALVLQPYVLPKGAIVFRFHGGAYPAQSFNPNVGKRIDVPEEGARFNPFPGAPP